MNILDRMLDFMFDFFDWFISLVKNKPIISDRYPKTISISTEAIFSHKDEKYRDRRRYRFKKELKR